jgi:DNA repair protein RadA/Sms
MKSSTMFVCQQCGYESPQWLGKCPECGEWNSLKEFKIPNSKSKTESQSLRFQTSESKPVKLNQINYLEKSRVKTQFSEADGVLGGGIVPGSVILLAGDPGIGKSTLLLQIAMAISKTQDVLYVSGEESEQQVKLRAKRLGNLETAKNFSLLSQTNVDAVLDVIEGSKPGVVIVDSIQTMESENMSGLSGSVGQIRYATASLIKMAKTLNIAVILVGHVTKEGMVAGPMVLSHMVDCVLFLEGEKTTGTRILRSLKNRFGPVDEVGVFVMEEKGLNEVKNPEQLFLTKNQEQAPGSVLVATMEGSRAFLVEIQALVVFSKLPMPRRVALGIDYRRLELLLAVLQKHVSLPLDSMDVFVNIAGGLKLSDPAADLAICLAIYSSLKNLPLSQTVAIGEVGLLGELRHVNFLEKRIRQAQKLGFKNIVTSESFKSLNSAIGGLK